MPVTVTNRNKNMQLKNFIPRPMREVNYAGLKIYIPADHEWVATTYAGIIYSFACEPYYEWQTWVTHELEPFVIYEVGIADKISDSDAANSLCYYPVEED